MLLGPLVPITEEIDNGLDVDANACDINDKDDAGAVQMQGVLAEVTLSKSPGTQCLRFMPDKVDNFSSTARGLPRRLAELAAYLDLPSLPHLL